MEKEAPGYRVSSRLTQSQRRNSCRETRSLKRLSFPLWVCETCRVVVGPCTGAGSPGLSASGLPPGSASSAGAESCPSFCRASVGQSRTHLLLSENAVNLPSRESLTFFSRLTVCCRTPADWLLRLAGRKWRISSISCGVRTSVLRWLSHTSPKASILTWRQQKPARMTKHPPQRGLRRRRPANSPDRVCGPARCAADGGAPGLPTEPALRAG